MRVKLTEEQYNRLLKENDKDFLDGRVNFKEIGNKIDRFIIRCFKFIKRKYSHFRQLSEIPIFAKKISQDMALPFSVCLVICYNYYLSNDGCIWFLCFYFRYVEISNEEIYLRRRLKK